MPAREERRAAAPAFDSRCLREARTARSTDSANARQPVRPSKRGATTRDGQAAPKLLSAAQTERTSLIHAKPSCDITFDMSGGKKAKPF
jgi:hypothetical protein